MLTPLLARAEAVRHALWPLKCYPHLVFYVERADHIDVWRVLHGERDIPSGPQERGE